ncbi:TfoX/Sxy family protein [Polaromonas sp. CT11-55]|uniref:TfoX/Sxy family protein n=1 Tax=Polaromonas sp. CT11-55 TaxID=3243045 RepID=UPI0039A46DE1
MASPKNDFAMYCCELLSGVGPCVAKRMFGGFGISTGGLTFALVADLGGGEILWLKADEATRGLFEAQGCSRFTYEMTRNGVRSPHSLGYYSAPEEAMESPSLMLPWARLALECALRARAAKPAKKPKPKPKAKAPAKAKTQAKVAPAKKSRA